MKQPWLDRLRNLFRRERQGSSVFDPVQFERLCLENPAAAQAVLQADQRELAEELEKTYGAYQAKLEEVAARLASLSPSEVRREARLLREAQDAMRRMLRRIEISSMTAQQLERELQEWKTRAEEGGPLHADHPRVRAEIIRSELASRGTGWPPAVIPWEASPFRASAPSPMHSAEDFEETEEDEGEGIMADHSDMRPDPEQLVRVIRLETREAERWHALPEADAEAIVQVRHLKELHGILKRLDRERGIRRNRLDLAVRMG